MSIVKRIYFGMGAIVILIVAAGGFAVLQMTQLANTFSHYRDVGNTSEIADSLTDALVEARLASFQFRTRAADDAVTRLNASFDLVFDQERALIERLEGTPELATFNLVSSDLRTYRETVQNIVNMRVELDAKRKELSELGTAARLSLSEISDQTGSQPSGNAPLRAAQSNVNLVLARVYFERFILTSEAAEFERSRKEVDNALQKMTWLGGSVADTPLGPLVSQAISDLERFAALSQQVYEGTLSKTAQYDILNAVGPLALSRMQEISNVLAQQRDDLGAQVSERSKRAIYILSVIVLIGVMLGSAMAMATGRIISRRISKVIQRMGELAQGNLDVEIDDADARTEVGQINAALAVFRDNAKKARQMDAEMKEGEKQERAREAQQQAQRMREEEEKRKNQEQERLAEQERLKTITAFQEEAQNVLDAAASGNFSNRMKNNQQEDDLRNMAAIINRLLEVTETNINDVMRSIGELSDGNLNVRISGDRMGAFHRMQEDFNAALETVEGSMRVVLQSGQSVSATASELETSSHGMAKRAETGAASIEETSAAVEEITASIKQVVSSAKGAEEAALRVRESAYKTQEASNQTEVSINQMTEASDEINRVINVIEDIAFQINLLALNAGVEAARAGEAGRGFSVVASEVRALAQRSKDAVQEINDVIQRNNKTVEEGVTKVIQSRTAVEGIIKEVEVVSSQISDIALAVEQQSQGIEEVNTAIQSIDSASQVNAATLEEMNAASVSLSAEARTLDDALRQFRTSATAANPPGQTTQGNVVQESAA